MGIEFIVSREVKLLGISSYYGFAEGVVVEKGRVDVREYCRKLVSSLLSYYNVERVKDVPTIRSYRDIMWRLGIDPTKTRVSSEALLRRVLKSGSFPHINNVVDACNIASLETLIPISVFDLSRVRGPLELRYSKLGEKIVDIDDNVRELKGCEIVLADSNSILHLYPHRDSKTALVDLNTQSVLVVAYGAPGVPHLLVKEAVERTLKYLSMFCYARYLSEVLKAE
ncbi:MAG: phenylalanine--tRNA ligase beta subunit-related protein [Sulfolobales archaeon]